jgi:hypothetical protein
LPSKTTVISFLIGATIAYVALTGNTSSEQVVLNSMIKSKDTISLWLNQPKQDFDWNLTAALNWTALNQFVDISVSPLGDLYGIQAYEYEDQKVSYAYKFDFMSGQWAVYD